MRAILIMAAAVVVAGCQGSQAPSSTPAAPVAQATVAPAAAPVTATPEPGSVPVNIDNFGRAASDMAFANAVKTGALGKFDHNREPTPIDKQLVVRQNRDTLYSALVVDLDAGPVTVTLPDPGGRFMSMQVFDEDQYTHMVAYKPGKYTFTRKEIGTRYALVALRMLADPNNAEDMKTVHGLQDQAQVSQPGGPGTFDVPKWDKVSLEKVTGALAVLGDSLPDKNRMFGAKGQVDPVRRLIGIATGWGGNPEKDAIYLGYTPEKNDGTVVHRLVVKDVPVDAFWSVTVYNAKGFFEANPQNAYSFNNLTAQKSPDGSIAIQFGGCDGKVPNCLPITPGWNYLVRLYRPRAEVLNGTYKFPEATPVQQ